MHFDRRLAGERGADFLSNPRHVRRAFLERRVDQLLEEGLHVVAHQLGRDSGDGEGVAGEALDLEADGPQLLGMRLEHRALRGSALEEHRRQKLLRQRLAPLDALEIAIEQDTLMSGMLVYKA